MTSVVAMLPLVYQEFKAAQSLYRKAPRQLSEKERAHVRQVAARQYAIEARVLESEEARGVCVPDATLAAAQREIRGRYQDDADFAADLAANGLTEPGLLEALRRDLAVEAVLERVSSGAARVSDVDLEIFYHLHRDRFMQPERRRARQILITINDRFPENRRAAALTRIREIRDRLRLAPERFAEQAMKHSECPTALQGGFLGEYQLGQMFPELERILFALDAGQVSDVAETHLGFHLLRCDAIVDAKLAPFTQAAPRIREIVQRRRAQHYQRAWVRQLFQPSTLAEQIH